MYVIKKYFNSVTTIFVCGSCLNDSTWLEQFLAISGSASAFSSIDHNAQNWMKRRKRTQKLPSPSTINNFLKKFTPEMTYICVACAGDSVAEDVRGFPGGSVVSGRERYDTTHGEGVRLLRTG